MKDYRESIGGFRGIRVIFPGLLMLLGASLVLVRPDIAVAQNTPRVASHVDSSQAWTATSPIPVPVGNEADLNSISCVSSTFCMAVGNADSNIWYPQSFNLADISEIWNGQSWSEQPMADIGPTDARTMESVSCVSSSFCMAVGTYSSPSSVMYNESQMWNGQVWKLLQSPPITLTTGSEAWENPIGAFGSVYCETVTFCVADEGTTSLINVLNAPFANVWDGSSWQMPPGNVSGTPSAITSIGCTSDALCIGSTVSGFVLWNGATWTFTTLSQQNGILEIANCSSAQQCLIFDLGPVPLSLPFSEIYNGSALTGPATIEHIGPGNNIPIPSSLSCISLTSCILAGSYYNLISFQTVIEDFDGTRWHVISSANPNEGPGSFDMLNSVSCVTSGFCMAVGYGTPANSPFPLPFALSGYAPNSTSNAQGYVMADASGGTYAYGAAGFHGSASGTAVSGSIVGIASPPVGGGYWLVSSDGSVYAYNEPFFGSLPSIGVSANNIVGMASSIDGKGYWLVSASGSIYSFGDAQFYGSLGANPPSTPIVGMATSDGANGYWLVSSNGEVFGFGNAESFGGPPQNVFPSPIVAIVATPGGGGYWLLSSGGGVYAFGDASFWGSTGAIVLHAPIVSMIPTPDGAGYWLIGSDGGVFAFGDAQYYGSLVQKQLNAPVVGASSG